MCFIHCLHYIFPLLIHSASILLIFMHPPLSLFFICDLATHPLHSHIDLCPFVNFYGKKKSRSIGTVLKLYFSEGELFETFKGMILSIYEHGISFFIYLIFSCPEYCHEYSYKFSICFSSYCNPSGI